MSEYSMPSYFQTMPVIGKEVAHFSEENAAQIQEVEQEIHEIREAALEAGKSTEALNESGQWTAMQRIEELVDEGTWCPLNSLYNPQDNDNGSVGIVKGLGRINGKWAVIIASDNKKLAGAWVPGQADALLRGSDTAKRLRIPLVYVLNCSGVKLDEQEKVYPNRRGGGTPFYRNTELNQMGIPVIVGIYGTNPAGGGYHSISPTILIAHEDANMAVGGAGIVGGMNPKGYVDKEAAEALIQAQKNLKTDIPGTVSIHYDETGFFREVYCDEEGVLGGIRKYIDMLPAYDRVLPRGRSQRSLCSTRDDPVMAPSARRLRGGSSRLRPRDDHRSCQDRRSAPPEAMNYPGTICTTSWPVCSTAPSSWSSSTATAPR